MIVVSAALKGGVGKTTTSVYLAALAASGRRSVTLVDADPQASAAEWIEYAADERLLKVSVVEAPTERLLGRALDRSGADDVVVVDTPPAHERLLNKALGKAHVVVIPTRVGGIETSRVEAVLEVVPPDTPTGLVVCSARTYTRSYQEALGSWAESDITVWGTVPERVAITAGPDGPLSPDGLEAYREVWRKAQSAARPSRRG